MLAAVSTDFTVSTASFIFSYLSQGKIGSNLHGLKTFPRHARSEPCDGFDREYHSWRPVPWQGMVYTWCMLINLAVCEIWVP